MKKAVIGFILLMSVLGLTGCSVKELLQEVPLTMQLEMDYFSEAELQAEGKNTEEAYEGTAENIRTEEYQEEPDVSGNDISGLDVSGDDAVALFLNLQASTFAYDSLSEQEQLWYKDIEQALGGMQEEVRLSEKGLEAGLDEEYIDDIFQCVLIDHPELFYVEGYSYTRYTRGEEPVAIEFSGKYELTREEASLRKYEIDHAVEALLSEIDMQASEYDKVKYVYDTVIKNTNYDLEAPDNQNIYSVLVGGSSVCQGYAKTVQYLLNCLGVECTLVQGSVESGEGHAWNMVCVDDRFYYVDATWGDASYLSADGQSASEQPTPEISYDYLCVTTGQLLRTHVIDNCVPLPECVDTAANYYVRENALFRTYDREQMEQLFQRAEERGQTDVTVKCADRNCFLEIYTELIDNQGIFDYMPDNSGTITYASNDKQLSLTFWMTNQ